MSDFAASGAADSFQRFLGLFRSSMIGFVAVGPSSVGGQEGAFVADGRIAAGRTTHGDGSSRILAFADPEAALLRFGSCFNAGIQGEVLLRMAAGDPECDGILVNSALTESSVVISKQTALRLFAEPGS